MKRFGYGERDRTSDTTTHDADFLQSCDMRRHPERSDKIADAVALFLMIELLGRRTDDLEDDLDCAARRIDACDRQRDTLSLFVHTQNDELPCLRFLSDEGCFDLH